jgi:hypothetical protein
LPPSFARWKASFRAEVRDRFFRIKSALHHFINIWLDSL